MGADEHTGSQEAAIAALARRQHGLLRRSDLETLGVGRKAIPYRVGTSRRLFALLPGVFALGSGPYPRPTLWLAAQWWCEDGNRRGGGPPSLSIVSHVTAGAFRGHGAEPDLRIIHLTTTGSVRSRRGIAVHRTRHLDPEDWQQHGLLRVTSAARTIVDEAGMLPFPALRTRVDRLRELPLRALQQTLERSPGRQGSVAARRLLDIEQRHTKSEFERRFLVFCREHRIAPPPELNSWVAGHKADCVYRTAWLVVELDGRAFHERRRAFQADRQRDTDYQLAHFRILRLTWWDLEPEWAQRTAEVLRAFLDGSRAP
ncbi:MAG: hypothetical protein H0V81_05750 [Solirubrobacterales bacterium]|nr:hypothetical protein [Solirubrobacterales bacterium]